jgi:O-methyltransferase
MKKLLHNFFGWMGLELHKTRYPLGIEKANFDRYLSVVSKNTMAPRSRLISLYEQIKYLDKWKIKGGIVECGVWKGGAMGLAALATLESASSGHRRDIHLFDSFRDICPPDPKVDGSRALEEFEGFTYSHDLESIEPIDGAYDGIGGHGTIEDCLSLLKRIGYPKESIFIHEGWFQDTVKRDASSIGPIALLRLDGDWYASTKICLDHLYELIVPGGFLIIDDYGTYDGCKRAVDEFFSEKENSNYFLNRIDNSCFVMQKFI